VALDDLVYLCTKLARQMDNQGVDKVGLLHRDVCGHGLGGLPVLFEPACQLCVPALACLRAPCACCLRFVLNRQASHFCQAFFLCFALVTRQVFEAMEAAREAIEDAKPLLQQAVKLSDEVRGGRVIQLPSAAPVYCACFGIRSPSISRQLGS